MTLKSIINEMESQDADFIKREEAENAQMQAEMSEWDGKEVTIIVNDSATVTAVIGFDKSNYVSLSKLSIEENDNDLEIDLNKVKGKAEGKLDKDLSDEIEISI